MGSKTLNDIFYKPDIGASGAVEKGKFDDGLDDADGLIEANKPANNKLSAFAVSTSEDLAGKISDEIGAGRLRFDTSVTVKTAAATLNVNEAGIILVSCAAVPYPIELPTPIGNVGLRFKIKKTDYNYNLITFTTVAGQFDFVNDDGILKDTYTRVNTPGAEVVFVADGANWQVIDEAMGQVPACWAYLDNTQSDFSNDVDQKVALDAEDYDVGDNFDTSPWVSGNCTSTSANHVVDTNGSFTSKAKGRRIKNTTDNTYTYVTDYTSPTDITVRDDIFVSGEGYEINNSKFVAPVAGKYNMNFTLMILGSSVVPDKRYTGKLFINFYYQVAQVNISPAEAAFVNAGATILLAMEKDDYVELGFKQESGVDTVGIYGSELAHTYLQVKLESKD